MKFSPTNLSPKITTCGPGSLLLQLTCSCRNILSYQESHHYSRDRGSQGRSAVGLQVTSPLGWWRMEREVPGMGHISPTASVPILLALSLWARQSCSATCYRLWYLDTGLFGESCFILREDPQGDRAQLLPLVGQAPRLLWLLLWQVLSPLI